MWFDDMVVGNIEWIARQSFSLCKNRADADDLAQDTLLKILSNRNRYDKKRDFKPWALTIMINTFKTRQARKMIVPFVDAEDNSYDAISANISDGLVRFHDVMNALRKASKMSLCVDCVIHYAKGYTYEEIADIEGINIGTVRSRISAGRKLIRQLIEA